MENKLEILNDQGADDKLNEHEWMGRKQAFNLVAGKTAAADVECLRRIRKLKLYRVKEVDWGGFCQEYAGVTKEYANRLIQRLQKFGPNYFHLSQVMRISPETYSQIAPAVSDAGITFGGETIAISPENSGKLAAAVCGLCASAPTKRRARVIAAAMRRLDSCLAELNRIREGGLNESDREDLASAVHDGLRDLTLLSLTLRIRA